MDLRLFWAVVKRFKRISIGGFALAVILAVFAYGTPGPGGITPRGSITYQSQAQLLITQGNGAYGRADPKTLSVGAPGYMSSLSPIYAGLANGNAVQEAVKAAKVPGTVSATEGVDPNTGAYTPFVTLTALAPSAADAARLSQIGIASFKNYVNQMEAASGVPASSRIALEVVQNGLPPTIASKPKPTIPVLVFIAVITGTIMLLFSLENKDPRCAAALGRGAPIVAGGNGATVVAIAEPNGPRGSGAHLDYVRWLPEDRLPVPHTQPVLWLPEDRLPVRHRQPASSQAPD
jgi:hypothetical protein